MSDLNRILGLRAIRSFRAEAVAEDDLAAILEAARWTGSAKNRQDWAFILVRDPTQKEDLAACGTYTRPLRSAPAAIALVQESGAYEFDTGRLAQNIMLAADAVGVASCPVTLHDDAKAGLVLRLPGGARCRYAVALGYPAAEQASGSYHGRKPLEDLVHQERYRF